MAVRHTRNMKRTTIWLTAPQVTALEKLSKKSGLKQAELIRRFIDAGLEKVKP
jgi:predicted DNA-binding protein